MDLLGSIGIGAVTGWMAGQLGSTKHVLRLLLGAGTAVGLILAEIKLFAGINGVLAACGALTLSFFIHRLWLQALSKRTTPERN
jgi:hypothetical protein